MIKWPEAFGYPLVSNALSLALGMTSFRCRTASQITMGKFFLVLLFAWELSRNANPRNAAVAKS